MRPLGIFYLLVFYVLLQFAWWAYLLLELNKEVYHQKIEIAELNKNPESLINKRELSDELSNRWIMVAGEGFVFMTILLLGIYKTRQAFYKEYSLARQQKNFLLSITHEFKSPLAAIKLNLQTIQKRALEKDMHDSMISRALNETDRIHNLIENALLAARIESHSFKLQKEEFNLTDCVRSTIQSRIIPGAGKCNIIMHLQEDVYMRGDPLAISSLVLNLLENAEKYSPENSDVTIDLVTDKKGIAISVADQGIGISDMEKNRIFEKFYRVGNEETRNTKGTGLGLFIVKHITDLHHGEIKVSDNVPSGTTFKVILPLN